MLFKNDSKDFAIMHKMAGGTLATAKKGLYAPADCLTPLLVFSPTTLFKMKKYR